MYLSYVGIRITDLERSLKFYTELFGLKEELRGDNSKIGGGVYILLRDQKSLQKLELNWYPPSSPYSASYQVGGGRDHISFKVDNVDETVRELVARGIEAVDLLPSLREVYSEKYQASFKVAYVKDPDGNWIEICQNPIRIGSEVPAGY